MKVKIHKECLGVRGIKIFKCLKCGEESNNYSNGIDVCQSCCTKENICPICGKPLPVCEKDKIIEILKQELDSVYCDTCNGEDCEGCYRKNINWSISTHCARIIANRIIETIEEGK